jgi:hypothetical protein
MLSLLRFQEGILPFFSLLTCLKLPIGQKVAVLNFFAKKYSFNYKVKSSKSKKHIIDCFCYILANYFA